MNQLLPYLLIGAAFYLWKTGKFDSFLSSAGSSPAPMAPTYSSGIAQQQQPVSNYYQNPVVYGELPLGTPQPAPLAPTPYVAPIYPTYTAPIQAPVASIPTIATVTYQPAPTPGDPNLAPATSSISQIHNQLASDGRLFYGMMNLYQWLYVAQDSLRGVYSGPYPTAQELVDTITANGNYFPDPSQLAGFDIFWNAFSAWLKQNTGLSGFGGLGGVWNV